MATTVVMTRGDHSGVEIRIALDLNDLEKMDMTPERLALELKHLFSEHKPFDKLLKDGMDNFFDTTDDINQMHVDHLVVNLEERSIFQIIMFLSRYCGWDRIKKQFDEYINSLTKEGSKDG